MSGFQRRRKRKRRFENRGSNHGINEVRVKVLQVLNSKSTEINRLVDSMYDKSKDPYTAAENIFIIFSYK